LRLTHNYAQTYVPSGTFTFNPDLTAANAISTAGSGSGLATFLLGYPSSGNVGNVNLVAGQQLYPAVFVNDDWHITPKLTLNVGLRWEHTGPWTERFDRESFFDPTRPNAVLARYGMNVLGNVGLVNSADSNYRGNVYPNWGQLAPRTGFAYQITPKTVVRAGGAVTYDSNREDGNADSNIQGFGGSFSAVGSYLSSGIAFQFKDGFNVTPDLVEGRPLPTLRLGPSRVCV